MATASTSRTTSAKTARKAPAKAAAPAAKKAPATRTRAPKSVAAPTDAVTPPKTDAAPKTGPAAEPKEKLKKIKLVRDSFTMPEPEYAVLGDVKKACLKAGIEVKKSELLRVGVALIRQLDTAQLKEILAHLPTLKAGRPKKTK